MSEPADLPPELPPTLRTSHEWEEITVPRVWIPQHVGERVNGVFVQTQNQTGEYGPYGSVLIRDDRGEIIRLRGIMIMDLFVTAQLSSGTRVRVIYTGDVNTPSEYKKRTYRLLVLRVSLEPEEQPSVPGAE